MGNSSNVQTAPSTGVREGVLPANWWQVAAAQGRDPQEVDFQRQTYGWTVGERVEFVPPAEVRVVNAHTSILLGESTVIAGLLLALAKANAKPAPERKNQT